MVFRRELDPKKCALSNKQKREKGKDEQVVVVDVKKRNDDRLYVRKMV